MVMLNIPIKWQFWQYVWGYYFGEDPRSFPKSYYDRVEKISFSPTADRMLDDISWNYQKQAWDLWNAPMELSGGYIHICSVPGDARSVFPDWKSFFAARCPWHYGTGKYPVHLSMLMTNWPHVDADWKAYDCRISTENGRRQAAFEDWAKTAEQEARRKLNQEQMNVNPFMVSAVYQAGTGNAIHIGAAGSLGSSAIGAILANGRRLPVSHPVNMKLS